MGKNPVFPIVSGLITMVTSTYARAERVSGFLQLLESGAKELKAKGTFTVELGADDLAQMMRQVVAQSEGEMKKQGIAAQINKLNVKIQNGKGEVSTAVTASKKVGFVAPKVNITADFGVENVNDGNGSPTGRIRTNRLVVAPETLFMVIKPKDFLNPYIEGEKINDTFKQVLGTEPQTRGATLKDLKLTFTPENKLRLEAAGR